MLSGLLDQLLLPEPHGVSTKPLSNDNISREKAPVPSTTHDKGGPEWEDYLLGVLKQYCGAAIKWRSGQFPRISGHFERSRRGFQMRKPLDSPGLILLSKTHTAPEERSTIYCQPPRILLEMYLAEAYLRQKLEAIRSEIEAIEKKR